MSSDPLLPIAPATVKVLLLPLGKIKAERFASFCDRIAAEHVVHLRDISPDGRPNRNMFSPLAYPDGVMTYDVITHVPPPSHLALSPFDLYREPMTVIGLADGSELHDSSFSKRHSANGTGPTVFEKNIRALYQELEDLRDRYPKALVHQVMIFDYISPSASDIPIPDDLVTIPAAEECKPTTMKTVMCDVSSLLLAEMTTLARSFEAMTVIESPGHYTVAKHMNGASWGGDHDLNGSARRNSQASVQQAGPRASSATGVVDRSQARMSMPLMPSRPPLNSSNSTPGRPSTPVKGSPLNSPAGPDGVRSGPGSGVSSPDQHQTPRPDSAEGVVRGHSRDKVSVQGFGPGGENDRWRLKGKGRTSIVLGSMYLQAGRWSDSLKELANGATAARSLNDHIWHGKGLELILMNLLLLGWSKLEFVIPPVCLAAQERPSSSSTTKGVVNGEDTRQAKSLKQLQALLPELIDRIIGLYSRISAESLPPLPLSEATIRFCKILSALHLSKGILDEHCLNMIVTGDFSTMQLTSSPRLTIVPSRQSIVNILFRAFPSSASELLTVVDRTTILSAIASVLGPLGYHRKKAMVIRELVSVLINGLVEARTKGAADAGVHPAAGLVSLAPGNEHGNGALALDLSEADIESGIEAFLDLLCSSYGVVGFDMAWELPGSAPEKPKDSDDAVVARIRAQSSARFFGFPSIKLNILRACINFSEALPDFNGVLKFSSDLLRTAGSGFAPGPRREDASAMIYKDEQTRLVSNIARTSGLVHRLGLTHLSAEYWDEFLVRGMKLEPLAVTRKPIPHAKSVLPGATDSRTSQDVNPFIYNPFLKKPDDSALEHTLVAEELATFKITLQNPYEVEVEIEKICLDVEGDSFEALTENTTVGPYRTQTLRLRGRPMQKGTVKVNGAIAQIRGCRERRFPIFSSPWIPSRDSKTKAKGLASLRETSDSAKPGTAKLEPESLSLNVIQAQPLIVVKTTSLPQSSLMILEGERQIFFVTLQNVSSTPVDFMLFSFKDSTQEPMKAAISNRDALASELYEYELILMKKQALRIPRNDQPRAIAPGGEATFEFEVLGKAGLTNASIQVDYTYLGVPRDELTEQFYTRQVTVDLTVTVNASVELARIDALPLDGEIPRPLLERLGASESVDAGDYFLLSMDLRNAWPSQMAIRLEGADGMTVDETILPGNTSRVIMPIKRVFLENPHETIPTLNPSRNRQFVVSTSKISPEMERLNREAFWYREKMLENLKVSWRTIMVPRRNGTVGLRNIRLTSRMIEAIKVDEIEINVSVGGDNGADTDTGRSMAYVDEFTPFKISISNRTAQPIHPLVRLMPALCHRPLNVALDYTRKLAWNGTLQQLLPELEPHGTAEFTLGLTALCRGDFEFTATVEEVQVLDKTQPGSKAGGARPRSETEAMMDAALGVRERRMWHLRRPHVVTVRDRASGVERSD